MEVPISRTVQTLEDAEDFAAGRVGLPVVVRPAFTLGGTGGGVARTRAELARIAESGLAASPIGQVLIEQYLKGWKEIEYEVHPRRRRYLHHRLQHGELRPAGHSHRR